MKFSFEGRWRLDDLKQALCASLNQLADDQFAPWSGVVWLSGVNLYFTPEDANKNLIAHAIVRGAPDEFLF